MDHGPVLAQKQVALESKGESEEADGLPYADVLEAALAREGGRLLADVLPRWIAGDIAPVPQDESKATYCSKINKEDMYIDLRGNPYQNMLKIRAYRGATGAYTYFERAGKKIRAIITVAHLAKDGTLAIDRIIPEGKREMPYEDFLRGGAVPAPPR
jgi:methionyl-tRNA formyltransferase